VPVILLPGFMLSGSFSHAFTFSLLNSFTPATFRPFSEGREVRSRSGRFRPLVIWLYRMTAQAVFLFKHLFSFNSEIGLCCPLYCFPFLLSSLELIFDTALTLKSIKAHVKVRRARRISRRNSLPASLLRFESIVKEELVFIIRVRIKFCPRLKESRMNV
jgi:hypothetical protein